MIAKGITENLNEKHTKLIDKEVEKIMKTVHETNTIPFHILNEEIIEMLNAIVEEKDIYTAGHSKRVAVYCVKIAEKMGLCEKDQTTLYYAGLLHDIGKILTPEAVILKPRHFSDHEYNIVKRHPEDGEKMVSYISSFSEYGSIIRHHHERYDGKGYPDGLKGDEIPLLSRIMSIADSFDAMTTNRIYKARCSIAEAIEEVKSCAGEQFDPNIIESACNYFSTISELKHVFQFPEDVYQEERFAFFFKDALTNVYSSEYLNYFLTENQHSKRFKYCCFIQLHHMHTFNQKYGWSRGNRLLIDIAEQLKYLFSESFVFRVLGDDFFILSKTFFTQDLKQIKKKLLSDRDIDISLQYLSCIDRHFTNWENLEEYFLHIKKD